MAQPGAQNAHHYDAIAGLPASNSTVTCPDNGTSCYFSLKTATYSFAQARAACSAMNGTVITYGDAEEQLAVEQYFVVSRGRRPA